MHLKYFTRSPAKTKQIGSQARAILIAGKCNMVGRESVYKGAYFTVTLRVNCKRLMTSMEIIATNAI